jgi:putative ABC transport system substrate-binding protein
MGAAMKRREFIMLLGGAPVVLPLAARAQQPSIPVIGFLGSASPVGWGIYVAAFRKGLLESGFVVGENVTIEYRWANDNYDRLPALAAELANLRVALIVASGGTVSAVAARSASSTIPIVFTGSPDPVGLGLVASLNRPGGNLTGLSILTTEILPKRFEFLSALVPKAEIFGMLVNPTSLSSADEAKVAQATAAARAISVVSINTSSEREFGPAFDFFVARKCDSLLVSVDPLFNSQRDAIIALAGRHRIPTMYGWPEFPRAGGMASYGPDLLEQYRLSGVFAGRILKGGKPQDIPVMQPTKFNFVLNLKTMKALNIEPPANILALADEVIE